MEVENYIKLLIYCIPDWNKNQKSLVVFTMALDFLIRLNDHYHLFEEIPVLSQTTDPLGQALQNDGGTHTLSHLSFSLARNYWFPDPEVIKEHITRFWNILYTEDKIESLIHEQGINWSLNCRARRIVASQMAKVLRFRLDAFISLHYAYR